MKRPAAGSTNSNTGTTASIFDPQQQSSSPFSFGQDVVEPTEAMRSCDVSDVEEMFSSFDLSTMPLLYNTSPILLNSFYQILKVAPDSDSSTVIAAHVRFLVRLPFVAAYMDKFVNADRSQWKDLGVVSAFPTESSGRQGKVRRLNVSTCTIVQQGPS